MPHEYLEKKLSEAYVETEQRIYKESFYHALCHDSIHLIEILIDKGLDYTIPIDEDKTAVAVAAEKETVKALEYLLRLSTRQNNPFPYKDLKFALEWCLQHRHHEIVEQLLYLLQRQVKNDNNLINFVAVKDYMNSLGTLLNNQNPIPVNQFTNLKNLLEKKLLTKRQLNYLYQFWLKSFPNDNPQALEIYNLLADDYYQIDKNERQRSAMKDVFQACIVAPILLIGSGLTSMVSLDIFRYIEHINYYDIITLNPNLGDHNLFLTIMLIILCIGSAVLLYSGVHVFYTSFKDSLALRREQLDRELIYHARKGDLIEVTHLVLRRRAHINAIAGISEATALYEAHRGGHTKVERFLIDNGGYSMQGNQLF